MTFVLILERQDSRHAWSSPQIRFLSVEHVVHAKMYASIQKRNGLGT